MIVCCRRAWLLCWLDQAMHTIGLNVRAICDWHDRCITSER